jgi:hypothetical protein
MKYMPRGSNAPPAHPASLICEYPEGSCMWNASWSTGARHRRRPPARAKEQRTRAPGGRSLELKSRSPGVRVRRFLSFASRIFGGPVWLNATLARSSPRGADRSYCRTGGSLGALPPPRPQVSPRAGVGLTPFAKASRGSGLGGPPAAGAAPRPHFGTTSGNALVWAGMRGEYERAGDRG